MRKRLPVTRKEKFCTGKTNLMSGRPKIGLVNFAARVNPSRIRKETHIRLASGYVSIKKSAAAM